MKSTLGTRAVPPVVEFRVLVVVAVFPEPLFVAGHGSMFHRAPGSIGCSAYPGRVVKGKKMPGRMGNDTVLRKNVVVVDIRADENVVLLKGPLPGAKNGLLKIFKK